MLQHWNVIWRHHQLHDDDDGDDSDDDDDDNDNDDDDNDDDQHRRVVLQVSSGTEKCKITENLVETSCLTVDNWFAINRSYFDF